MDLDDPSVMFRDGTSAGLDSDYGCGVLPQAQVRPLGLEELDGALGAIAEDEGDWMVDTWVIDTDPPARTYDVEMLEGIALHTGGPGELCVLVDLDLPRRLDEDFEARIPGLVEPMIARSGARYKAPYYPPDIFPSDHYVVMIEFLEMSHKRVADLLDLATDVQALLRAARRGDFDRSVARGLLLAGHATVLLGQPESQWLEVKSQLWPLDTPAGKAEAAKDLSALANAGGGLMVIPAKSTAEAGRDIITSVKALPLRRFDETQLRDSLATWTVPPLQGIDIDIVDQGSDRGMVIISVPACAPEDWPHLVVGDEQAAFPSAAIAAYYRDGDSNRAISPAQLHALIRRNTERR